MIFKIIKNSITEKDYEIFTVESDCFTFTDNASRDEIGDGVLLLKMILDYIKPNTVIDVQDLEGKLAMVSLQKYDDIV